MSRLKWLDLVIIYHNICSFLHRLIICFYIRRSSEVGVYVISVDATELVLITLRVRFKFVARLLKDLLNVWSWLEESCVYS